MASLSPMQVDFTSTILGITWAETFLGLVFYVLRFFSNWRLTHRFRWDFTLASLTVLIQFTAQIFLQVSVDSGMGHHITELQASQIVAALKWGWVYQLLAIAASVVGKLAIIAFLLQIRGRHDKKPWFLWITGALILAINITVFGTILGQCKPVAKLWNNALPGTCDPGRKLNQNYSYFQASFNSAADACLALYPVTFLAKLQMKLRIKVALCILMGMGWIAAACSAVKTYELQRLTQTTDITFALSPLLIWASTEAWIVVIVGCVPPIRPLAELILQRLGLSKKSQSPRSRYYRQGYSNFSGTNGNTAVGTQIQSQAYGARGLKSGGDIKLTSMGGGYGIGGYRAKDELSWLELNEEGQGDMRVGSKEEMIAQGKGVVVTTDVELTESYVDKEMGRGRNNGGSSGRDSQDSWSLTTTEVQKAMDMAKVV